MPDIYATTIRIVVSASSPAAAAGLFNAIGDGPATLVGSNGVGIPLAWVNIENVGPEHFADATDGNDVSADNTGSVKLRLARDLAEAVAQRSAGAHPATYLLGRLNEPGISWDDNWNLLAWDYDPTDPQKHIVVTEADLATADDEPATGSVELTLDQVIDEATAMGLLGDENEVATFNRLLDTLDAVDTDEPGGEQRYQDAREACFAFVDNHPEVLPLARDYGLPISAGELPGAEQPAADRVEEIEDPTDTLMAIERFLGRMERASLDGLAEDEQQDVKRAYHLLRAVADTHAEVN